MAQNWAAFNNNGNDLTWFQGKNTRNQVKTWKSSCQPGQWKEKSCYTEHQSEPRPDLTKMMQYDHYLFNQWQCNFQIEGLVQDCGNSIALAMELPQSCIQPQKCKLCYHWLQDFRKHCTISQIGSCNPQISSQVNTQSQTEHGSRLFTVWNIPKILLHIDGLLQKRGNSSVSAIGFISLLH